MPFIRGEDTGHAFRRGCVSVHSQGSESLLWDTHFAEVLCALVEKHVISGHVEFTAGGDTRFLCVCV